MRVHFIGIGGIGLSALAKFLKSQNYVVSGSDISSSSITDKLEKVGVKISIPHSIENIDRDIDFIIYSAVIKESNVELRQAKELNLKIYSRSEALKFLLRDREVFSVCGAHGKSTTTAILASILKDSSAIIGAESKEFNSNFRDSNSESVVFEADESDGSFLNSNPHIAIVTNAEPEHMEFYNYDLVKFYNCYTEFLNSSKIRVINAEDEFLKSLDIDAVKLYPSKDISEIEFTLIEGEPYTEFRLRDFGKFLVWGFGEHIAIDASLAILSAMSRVSLEEIRENIKSFKGIKKRFDILKDRDRFILIDDYGHHPTEIEATLKSLKIYSKLKGVDRVIAIWQPHKYSRTLDNLEHFIECFSGVDELIILPVWRAGESEVEIDFAKYFSRYRLTFADSIKVDNFKLSLIRESRVIREIDSGAIIGFGAGDITYQLRGTM